MAWLNHSGQQSQVSQQHFRGSVAPLTNSLPQFSASGHHRSSIPREVQAVLPIRPSAAELCPAAPSERPMRSFGSRAAFAAFVACMRGGRDVDGGWVCAIGSNAGSVVPLSICEVVRDYARPKWMVNNGPETALTADPPMRGAGSDAIGTALKSMQPDTTPRAADMWIQIILHALERGANPNVWLVAKPANLWMTALECACYYNEASLVEALLIHNADPNQSAHFKDFPTRYFCRAELWLLKRLVPALAETAYFMCPVTPTEPCTWGTMEKLLAGGASLSRHGEKQRKWLIHVPAHGLEVLLRHGMNTPPGSITTVLTDGTSEYAAKTALLLKHGCLPDRLSIPAAFTLGHEIAAIIAKLLSQVDSEVDIW